MILRPHQSRMIADTRAALRTHRNVLLQGPTGVGKTVLAAFMAFSAAEKQRRVTFICHRRELIDQTAKTFEACGISHGYIAAGHASNYYIPVQIASIDTLKNRLDKVPVPHICIWDECHHLGAAGWARVHSYYNQSYHVGLSATPQRLDGKGLGKHFDVLVRGPSVAWLIEQGFLARYKLYSVPGVDLAGVHTRMGDYVRAETEHAMDTSQIMGDIVRHWRQYAGDKLTIAFGVTRRHSEHIAAQFRANGIPAVHLDGETPKAERRDKLRALARGEIRVVSNVGLFGEGYDLAANSGLDVAVGCVIDAAPTQSLGAWLQRCGRALRPQDCAIILDHAGNALRHGMPCDEREWTLEGRDKAIRNAGAALNVRQCPACYAVHRPAPACTECGHVYEVAGREVEEVAGELAEIDPDELRRRRAMEQGAARGVAELTEIGRRRGIRNPQKWAQKVVEAREHKEAMRRELIELIEQARKAGADLFGHMPRSTVMELKPKALQANIALYRAILEQHAAA